MIAENSNEVSVKVLRRFGITLGLMLGVFLGVIVPLLFSYALPIWPWLITLSLTALALARPATLQTAHRFWFALGHSLNRITSPILMAIIFFGLFLPIGLAKRLFQASKVTKGFAPGRNSYREDVTENSDMRDPF